MKNNVSVFIHPPAGVTDSLLALKKQQIYKFTRNRGTMHEKLLKYPLSEPFLVDATSVRGAEKMKPLIDGSKINLCMVKRWACEIYFIRKIIKIVKCNIKIIIAI